jgi:hypothetical protein
MSCGEEGCSRLFQSGKNFRNHLKLKHSNQNTSESTINFNSIVNDFEPENCEETQNRHEEKPHKKLFDSLLTFILYLYGLPNLPRTTARNIITKVWNLIVVEYTQSTKETADENTKKILEEFLKNNCVVLYFKNI